MWLNGRVTPKHADTFVYCIDCRFHKSLNNSLSGCMAMPTETGWEACSNINTDNKCELFQKKAIAKDIIQWPI